MKDLTPLPIDESGNGSNIVQVSFELADLPMIISALQIGRNTVMMCGGGKAEKRMNFYVEMVKKLAPAGWEHFQREEDIANIALAMAENPEWSIHQKKRWKSDKKGESVVTVGKMRWETWSTTDEEHAQMIACLQAIAPLTCDQVEKENEYDKSW